MSEINWYETFNSATTFSVLLAIAVGIWVLIIKKDLDSKPSKRKKK